MKNLILMLAFSVSSLAWAESNEVRCPNGSEPAEIPAALSSAQTNKIFKNSNWIWTSPTEAESNDVVRVELKLDAHLQGDYKTVLKNGKDTEFTNAKTYIGTLYGGTVRYDNPVVLQLIQVVNQREKLIDLFIIAKCGSEVVLKNEYVLLRKK